MLKPGDHILHNHTVHLIKSVGLATTNASKDSEEPHFKAALTVCNLATRKLERPTTDLALTCIRCLAESDE